MSADTAKYWAFISYSHRDAGVAAALQRDLETYRLPRWIVGRRTDVGTVPEFLKPVFRDREEIQATADLKAVVRIALQQSRFLIVVCSPDAARSPWVNQEIVEFKKLHGESRVLALIASGEPFASRIPGRETEECFPEALRFALTADGRPAGEPREPVAADLRPQGDGKRLALLKIVAGMAAVGVDDLVHRDAQRRARRLAVVATLSVIGMAVMGVLTWTAVQSRNEAQRQRAQAEGLIEYMLGDLRKRLDPVGRLDVLDSLGEKALAYYGDQDADRLDAGSLGRRSRAQHLIGEMREQRGQLADALTAFRSAADTTEQLLRRAPNDGQRIFDHAQSVYWVGYIAWRRGQAQAAEDAFLKYRELAQRLLQIDPANIDWQVEAAYASENLGVVQLGRGRLDDAMRSLIEAKTALTKLLGARPSLAAELAENEGWMAKTREAADDYRGATAAQENRLAVLRQSPDFAKDRQAQRQSVNAIIELARLQLSLGNLAVAQGYARDATAQAEALVASDPSNMTWQSELCFARVGRGEIEVAMGRRDAAAREVSRVMPQLATLLASDSTAVNWQIKLNGRALVLEARTALPEKGAELVAELESYLRTVKRFEATGVPLAAEESGIAATAELALGDWLDRLGKRDSALAHWQAAAARLEPFARQDHRPAQTQLALARLRLGQIDAARALAAQVENSNYRHPAYADLVAALASAAGPKQAIARTRRE